MLTIDAAGSRTPVPLNPQSPYAPLARWYSVATDGTRIIAIGGANGGAHAQRPVDDVGGHCGRRRRAAAELLRVRGLGRR